MQRTEDLKSLPRSVVFWRIVFGVGIPLVLGVLAWGMVAQPLAPNPVHAEPKLKAPRYEDLRIQRLRDADDLSVDIVEYGKHKFIVFTTATGVSSESLTRTENFK